MSDLRITVLGCSGTYAGPDASCSGYLVQGSGMSVLLDAGAGTLAELQKYVALTDLDAVFLSHSHPDHWMDAATLRNALKYVLGCGGLAVYSTAETQGLLRVALNDSDDDTFNHRVIADGDEVMVGQLRVCCSRTDHPPETLAFAVDDGERQMAYSADTGPNWSFAKFEGACDVALCEATLRLEDDGPPVHLSAHQAGAMAKAAGVGRLVITHLLPGADPLGARIEAEAAYGATVIVARPGMTIHV